MTEKPKMTFQEKLASGYYIRPAKPKPVAVVSMPMKHEDAQGIAANPESVRVSYQREDGVSQIARPQRNDNSVTIRYDLVRDVDEYGRPVWNDDAGVVSDYHPWSGLRR